MTATNEQGPSQPGKYILRLEYELEVTDPLALAAGNLATGPDDTAGFGVEILSAQLMQAFGVRLLTWDTRELGFKIGNGTTALFTPERYAKVNPAYAYAHPEVTPEE